MGSPADSNIFRVTAYGAWNTATASSLTAVQDAINAAGGSLPDVGTNVVLFDLSVISIPGTVNLLTGVSLISHGQTQIYGPTASNTKCFVGTNIYRCHIKGLVFGPSAATSGNFTTCLELSTDNIDAAMITVEDCVFHPGNAIGLDEVSFEASRSTITRLFGNVFASQCAFKVYSDVLEARGNWFSYNSTSNTGAVMTVNSMATISNSVGVCYTTPASGARWIDFTNLTATDDNFDLLRQLHLENNRFSSENAGMTIINSNATGNYNYGSGIAAHVGVTIRGGYYGTLGAASGKQCVLLVQSHTLLNFVRMGDMGGSTQPDGMVNEVSGYTLPTTGTMVLDPFIFTYDHSIRKMQMFTGGQPLTSPTIKGRIRT